MAHEIETMAYAVSRVGVPWHGLGNPVHNGMTVEEMLQAAGLDWENKSEPLFIRNSDGSFTCLDDTNADNTAYRAIMRTSDGYIHSIMTDDYHIAQNATLMEFLKEYKAE